MGWCTTADLDRFAAAAGGYLRSTAAENSLLLSAVQVARSSWDPRIAGRPPGTARPQGTGTAQGTAGSSAAGGLLFGWWEPPDGSEPRGAFLHDPSVPLLLAGRAPEMAAALAGTLSKMGRHVCGVDGPIEAADAFAAAWSHRAGSSIRMHRQCRVFRLTAAAAGGDWGANGAPIAGGMDHAPGPAAGGPGAWQPPRSTGPNGVLHVATAADRALLIDWLAASASETGERIGSAQEMADDLIGYGGAVFWETAQRTTSRIREAAQYRVGPLHRDAGQHRDTGQRSAAQAEAVHQSVAMAILARPVAGTVRISMVYTPPELRRNGYAAAVTLGASRAVLAGDAPAAAHGAGSEAVLITDRNKLERLAARLGYQLVDERAVLRFGPPTGPLPNLRATGPMPRLPTGPLPRFRR